MKKIFTICAAALAIAATSCLNIDPDNVDGEVASVDVKDVNFITSITYTAPSNVPAGTKEVITFNDKATIDHYLSNYTLKGNIEIKGEVENQTPSSVGVSCIFKGINGKNVAVKLDGKDKMSFGSMKTTPVTITFAVEEGFSTFDAIEFTAETEGQINKDQKIVFKTKTLSASAGVTLK